MAMFEEAKKTAVERNQESVGMFRILILRSLSVPNILLAQFSRIDAVHVMSMAVLVLCTSWQMSMTVIILCMLWQMSMTVIILYFSQQMQLCKAFNIPVSLVTDDG